MKFTKNTLKKIEDFLVAIDYDIIYGKGNFQSGYAVVESQRKIVINRYFEIEARINSLLEIIDQIQIPEDTLDEEQLAFLNQMYKYNETREATE